MGVSSESSGPGSEGVICLDELDTAVVEQFLGEVQMGTLRRCVGERIVDLNRYEVLDVLPEQRVTYAEGDCAVFYLHIFKGGFHLPLRSFFKRLLSIYGVSPNQLKPNSWSIMVSYFIVCQEKGWEPSVDVFRHLFMLRDSESCLYHLQARKGEFLVVDLQSNAHVKKQQFFIVKKRAEKEWGFLVVLGYRRASCNAEPALEDWGEEQVEYFHSRQTSYKECSTSIKFKRYCLGAVTEEGKHEVVSPVRRGRVEHVL